MRFPLLQQGYSSNSDCSLWSAIVMSSRYPSPITSWHHPLEACNNNCSAASSGRSGSLESKLVATWWATCNGDTLSNNPSEAQIHTNLIFGLLEVIWEFEVAICWWSDLLIIITEIYFTLSRSSRTNSQEKSTHAGGTISVIMIMRPLEWEDKSV